MKMFISYNKHDNENVPNQGNHVEKQKKQEEKNLQLSEITKSYKDKLGHIRLIFLIGAA